MTDRSTSTLVLASLCTVIVAALAVPALRSIHSRYGSAKSGYHPAPSDLYEDRDGKASSESQAAFSQLWPRAVALAASSAGLGIAVAAAVLVTTLKGGVSGLVLAEVWLRAAAWILLEIQAISLFIELGYTKRFELGVYAALGAFALTLVTVINCFVFRPSWLEGATKVFQALIGLQIGTALIALVSFISLQRRPDVYDDSDGLRIVDRELTTSALSLLTYAWPHFLLRKARKQGKIDYEDLPQLRDEIRCKSLSKGHYEKKRYSRLWLTVLVQYRWPFFLQILLSIISWSCEFLPQVSLLKLLQALESQDKRAGTEAWLWVALLGLSFMIIAVVESRLFFTIESQIGIPLRNQLASLIFEKALRRNDVKGGKKKWLENERVVVNENSGGNGETTNLGADDESKKKGDDELEQETRQGTINLIGVDGARVADFCTYFEFYPGTIIKLSLSIVFLVLVIGWKPLLAGIAAFSVTIPINVLSARRYMGLQDELMSTRDRKLAIVTEALQGIRQIKFSALEKQWQTKIGDIRKKELSTLWSTFILDLYIIMCYIASPVILSAVCLTTYALMYDELKPSVAFTTLSVLGSLELALSILPELTTEGIDAWISINRIEAYLNAPEKEECRETGDRIVFKNADVAWPTDDEPDNPDRFVLRNINIDIPPKELTVISGKTGSGKSLLLAAIMGEIDKISGTIYAPENVPLEERFDSVATKNNWIIDSAVAFVAQIPWIENATIKDNILFGLPYDKGRYDKTIKACALLPDMKMQTDGDETEIGHNGVNLSGGQRWRVSFARALYSRAGILVLDDIFSAVDAHVGRQLFEEALTGELSVGRTRILVTHHVSMVLPKTDYSVHLANGTVSHAGLVKDLKETGALQTVLKETKHEDPDASSDDAEDEEAPAANGLALTKTISRRSGRSAIVDDGGSKPKVPNQPRKFVEDEKREQGAIKWKVFKEYWSTAGGWKMVLPMMLAYLAAALAEIARNWWVAKWTAGYEVESSEKVSFIESQMRIDSHQTLLQSSNFSSRVSDEPSPEVNTSWYLGIYLVFQVVILITCAAKIAVGLFASMRASRTMFDNLLYTILRTPLRWLDTVPVGRVLNRFTGDFNTIDSNIVMHTRGLCYNFFQVLAITVVSFVVSPIMIPLAVVLLACSGWIAGIYLIGTRPVKRLENNARSPIYELFGTVLIGMTTIRSFSKSSEYISRMWKRIDQHGRSKYHLWVLNRWMGFRLSMLAAVFVIAVSCFIVASGVPAGTAGFVLSFTLSFSEGITWVLRNYAAYELDMTAAERVSEYSHLPIESQEGNEPPASWPTHGKIEVRDLEVAYAPELPLVLKGLNFEVTSGQRVGVVGRTGAGKSSLTLALFRFLDQRKGSVKIDGIDTSTITLNTLRSRLAIIPQDPVLFSGTVKSNLDPFSQHGEAELREALQRVHLVASGSSSPTNEETQVESATEAETDVNKNPFKSLQSTIAEGGLNLSQGQRQLLCLARAIVSRPKVMILDEATSAVDKDTDELIQRSIREEFTGSTLLVIAHRLSTIADFDKILVMGNGKVLEFGTPKELYEKEDGTFRGMVEESGERDGLEKVILGH